MLSNFLTFAKELNNGAGNSLSVEIGGLAMLTYDEVQDEIEFWKEEEWERKNGKDFFRTIVKVENGIEVEYHMAGDRCTVKCEKKTGKLVK